MGKKKTIRKDSKAGKRKPKFNKELQPIYEKVLSKHPIAPEESTKLLLAGNQKFAEKLFESHLTLAKLARRPIDELLFICSDARAGLVLDLELFQNLNVVPVFSAGNVVPVDKNSTPHSTQIIKNILKLMTSIGREGKKNIRIMGHEQCGAVTAAKQLKKRGDPNHPRDVLDLLTNEVSPTNERGNVLAQSQAAQDFLNGFKDERPDVFTLSIVPSFFQWRNKKTPVEGKESSLYEEAFRRKEELGIVRAMKKQFSHAILITSANDPDVRIPVDLRTLFGIEGPNEAFLVTAKWPLGGALTASFDSISKASVLYALLHAGATNVVLVHHCTTILDRWAGELSMFFDSLKKSTNEQEKSIGEKFGEGTIGITSLKVHIPTGTASVYSL